MFVLHWSSPCWSKLNAEVSLFYFLPFHNPSFFSFSFSLGRKTDLRTVPSLHSVCLSSVGSPVQSHRSRLFSLTNLIGCVSV